MSHENGVHRRSVAHLKDLPKLFLLSVAAALPFLVFALFAWGYFSAEAERRMETRLIGLAEAAIQSGDLAVVRNQEKLATLAPIINFEQALERQALWLLNRDGWYAVQLSDSNGRVLRSFRREDAPIVELASPDDLKLEAASSFVTHSSSGMPLLELRIPIPPEPYFLRAILPLENFSDALGDLEIPDGWLVALLDPSNRIAGRSRSREAFVGESATSSLADMIEASEKSLFYSYNQEGQRVYTSIGRSSLTGWNAAVGAPADIAERAANQARWSFWLGMVFSLLLAALAVWVVARNIIKSNALERAHQELKAEEKTEARLQDIAANFPGVIYRRVLQRSGDVVFPFISSPSGGEWAAELEPLRRGPVHLDRVASVYADADARKRFYQEIERTAANGGVFSLEGRIQLASGKMAWVRSVASTTRSSDGRVIWDGALLDITEQKETEEALQKRTAALETVKDINVQIAAELNTQKLVQSVTDATTRLIGADFGAFFHNPNDNETHYRLYTLSGAQRSDFESFPMPRHTEVFGPTLRGERTVLSDDITAEAAFGKNPPYYGMPEGHLPVRSYLAVPVTSRTGEVFGGLFFGHRDRAVFDADAAYSVEGIAAQMAVALDNARMFEQLQEELEHRKRSEEHQRVLLSELNHRVKNTLAVVVSLANQTIKESRDKGDFSHRFRRRLIAISDAHTLLSESGWRGGALKRIIEAAVKREHFRVPVELSMRGPNHIVSPRQAVALSLAFGELVARAGGDIDVVWELAEGELILVWSVPKVIDEEPDSQFGMQLAELNIRHECAGSINYVQTGDQLKVGINIPTAHMLQ